jgi:uracil-DNA glycosylase
MPPGNKPMGSEINACRQFLEAEIAALPDLEIILALGAVAHGAAAATLGLRPSRAPFRHGAFHCSRYNLNTGRLTEEMFESVLAEVRRRLDAAP